MHGSERKSTGVKHWYIKAKMELFDDYLKITHWCPRIPPSPKVTLLWYPRIQPTMQGLIFSIIFSLDGKGSNSPKVLEKLHHS